MSTPEHRREANPSIRSNNQNVLFRIFEECNLPMTRPGFAETAALVAVLEQKSFAKAARQLGLSPPRVSELVRALEERLGVRLVERTTRSVAPTAAGERLAERLRPVLDDYDAALDATNEFRSKPAGTLRLTVAPLAADHVLSQAAPRFLALYPEISLDISVDVAFTDIVAARFDAGIRAGERVERDMIAVRVSDAIPFVVVAAPSYLARRGEPRAPRDLVAHECIRVRLPNGATLPWRLRVKRRTAEAHVQGRLIVNDTNLAIRAALAGTGLLQLPRRHVMSDLAAGRLVTVLDRSAPLPLDGLFLYYPGRRLIRPALKAFADFLRRRERT
jgi:LysR family transcriptional regulator, regulator of peptidoglycan recycling